MSIIKKYKETSLSILLLLICFLLYALFPSQGFAQKITSLTVFFIIFPSLLWIIIRKEKLKNLGLTIGDWKRGLIFSALSLTLSLLIFFIIFKTGVLKENYPLPKFYMENFWAFLIYEFLIMGFFLCCFSFFFSGIILFSTEKELGKIAPIFQFILFLIFLFVIGSFKWLFFIIMLNIFFGGFIAQKSRSLIYPIISGLIFSLITDALIIKFII